MKKLEQVGVTLFETMYHSPFYTVVRASASVKRGKNTPEKIRFVHTEGISRRSWRDAESEKQGVIVATGRADKAMRAKLGGKKIWPRIQKATDLLSNG